jgi:hypothetical protein
LDGRDGQIDIPGIQERHNLRRAGDADRLVPEVKAGWGK